MTAAISPQSILFHPAVSRNTPNHPEKTPLAEVGGAKNRTGSALNIGQHRVHRLPKRIYIRACRGVRSGSRAGAASLARGAPRTLFGCGSVRFAPSRWLRE